MADVLVESARTLRRAGASIQPCPHSGISLAENHPRFTTLTATIDLVDQLHGGSRQPERLLALLGLAETACSPDLNAAIFDVLASRMPYVERRET